MTATSTSVLARRVAVGRGLEPADLTIKNARVLDVASCELFEGDVAIAGGVICGVGPGYDGAEILDAKGLTVVPGFVDAHLHVESSLVTPFEFERCALPRGVTTAICDPHEIANVLGLDGVRYFLACAERMRMDLRVQLPSCVPATPFETSGAKLEAGDLAGLSDHPKVIGLAEVMNFPGVLAGDPGVLAKLAAFEGRRVDGHAPLLRGRDLCGYAAAGITTEHEATAAAEAREKLRQGLTILIREGSVSKDLDALSPILTQASSAFVAFCTDDRNPLDIAEEGHLDALIRRAIKNGVPAPHAYRAASWSAANAFGLRDRGLVAPGRRADLVLVDDFEGCGVRRVLCAGKPVEPGLFDGRGEVPPVGLASVKRRPVDATAFPDAPAGDTPVIGVVPGRIITEHLTRRLPDPSVNRVAVLERHGVNGNVGLGHVHGFGLQRGAIASTVGHDSHNLTVVGADAGSMATAVNRLIELQGGFAVADGGGILAELALPLAGLMSLEPFEEVHAGLLKLRAAARSLGCALPEPFLQVAFLPLPVIPHLKITDRGLFDVDRFELLSERTTAP